MKIKSSKVTFRLSPRELEKLDAKAKSMRMDRTKFILYRCTVVC